MEVGRLLFGGVGRGWFLQSINAILFLIKRLRGGDAKPQTGGVPSRGEELLPVDNDGRRLLAWLELGGATDASDLILAIRPIRIAYGRQGGQHNASDGSI
jgi:hypothetical protein